MVAVRTPWPRRGPASPVCRSWWLDSGLQLPSAEAPRHVSLPESLKICTDCQTLSSRSEDQSCQSYLAGIEARTESPPSILEPRKPVLFGATRFKQAAPTLRLDFHISQQSTLYADGYTSLASPMCALYIPPQGVPSVTDFPLKIDSRPSSNSTCNKK